MNNEPISDWPSNLSDKIRGNCKLYDETSEYSKLGQRINTDLFLVVLCILKINIVIHIKVKVGMDIKSK